MGIISSIGNNVEENFISLQSGKHGISDIEMFETRHAGQIKTGEIKLSNEALVKLLHLDEDNNITRTSLLGMTAAKEAVESAGISDINSCRTGLISSTSVGWMDVTEKYFYTYEDFPDKQKYIDAHDAGNSSLAIAGYLGLKGMVSTISTACSSAANAIMMGAKLIKNGVLDRVIVGGADSLSKFTLNGFNTLMILTDSYNTPFDNNRKGLNLGEAAAFLVLESEEIVKKENKKVLAYLSGYGNANDAHHQTASSENGQGAFLAMQQALKISGLTKENIDYINVHGTSTPLGDISELKAIKNLFGEHAYNLNISATKSMTGHLLGATGAVEAIISVLSVKNDIIPPTINHSDDDIDEEIDYRLNLTFNKAQKRNVRAALSNTFGFGGHNASIIVKKI